MKLNQTQVDSYLKQNSNLEQNYFYWINSEDGYLLQDNLKKLKKYLNDFHTSNLERIVYHLDSHTDWQLIKNTILTPSLFSDKQIIELHFINKISTNEQQALIELAELVNKYKNTVCLIIYPFRVESKALKQKWMTSLDNNGVIITIWPPNNNDYPAWLRRECQRYKVSIPNPKDFEYFCQKTMGNPTMAAQTLYKLRLQETTSVDKQALEAVLAEHANYTIFDLVDSYLVGNIKQCFIILKALKRSSQPELLILWSLRKELLLLAEILETAASLKKSPQVILQDYKLWQNKKATVSQALTKFNLEQIYNSLQLIAQIEKIIKTESNKLLVWQNIEQLFLFAKNITLFHEQIS